MSKNKPIFVTQPSLPPLSEYTELLEEVWKSGILTHNGPKVIEFEEKLKLKLKVEKYFNCYQRNNSIATCYKSS